MVSSTPQPETSTRAHLGEKPLGPQNLHRTTRRPPHRRLFLKAACLWTVEEEKEAEEKKEDSARERRRQEAILAIKKKYGKNAILKGLNFEEGATQRERNKQVGGHKA